MIWVTAEAEFDVLKIGGYIRIDVSHQRKSRGLSIQLAITSCHERNEDITSHSLISYTLKDRNGIDKITDRLTSS